MVTLDEFAFQIVEAVQRMRDANSDDHRPGWSRTDAALRAVMEVIEVALLRAEAADTGASREEQLAIGPGFRFQDKGE